MEIRLQKFLAEAGVASRRKSEEIIKEGKVTVNNKVVTEMGFKINPNKDIVKYKNVKVKVKDTKVYILLNKPEGYVTTVKDQFDRPAVMDLVKKVDARIYPVGRLDYHTSGLLILTNDGDFAYKVTHPKHELPKTYRAVVKGIPTEKKLDLLRNGMELEDYSTSPAKVRIVEKRRDGAVLEVIIHEGKNRQVREMFKAIGNPVLKLRRTAIGNIEIHNLKEGTYRHLTKQERLELVK